LGSVHASDTLALSGPLNRNPFRLWLTIRKETKARFEACQLDCAVVSAIFARKTAAAEQFYAFFLRSAAIPIHFFLET
jgi:hypothetical protein